MDNAGLVGAAYWASFWDWIEDKAFVIVVVALAIEYLTGRWAKSHHTELDQARELRVAQLQTEAQTARAQIADAQARVAASNERAAVLENETAKLRTSLSWRRIWREQHQAIVSSLKSEPSGKVDIFWVESDPETWRLAEDIRLTFIEAGWTTFAYPMLISGNGLSMPGADDRIERAFDKARISFAPQPPTPGSKPPTEPTIYVGSRPPFAQSAVP